MRISHCLPLAATLFAAAVLSGCPPLLSPGVIRTPDLVYGKGNVESDEAGIYTLADLRYDLIEKEGTEENRPAVLMIHGGSFEEGSKEDEKLIRQADALALAGYACFLIDYRLKGDNPPAPQDWEPDSNSPLFEALNLREAMHASFVDAKVALRYIRANASALRVDPDRIAIWGESAGAFAALAAGLTTDELFTNDGPGFTVPPEYNPGTSARVSAIVDCWGSAAPVIDAFDPTDPPVMIFHGAQDFTVGLALGPALDIRDACVENGIPVAYYPISGEAHGAWEGLFEGQTLAELTVAFLGEHVKKDEG
jgi:pimeloyl-ACP methyl ester carboxylesterase